MQLWIIIKTKTKQGGFLKCEEKEIQDLEQFGEKAEKFMSWEQQKEEELLELEEKEEEGNSLRCGVVGGFILLGRLKNLIGEWYWNDKTDG